MALQLKISPWKKTVGKHKQRFPAMELFTIHLPIPNQQFPRSKTLKTLQPLKTHLPKTSNSIILSPHSSIITKRRTLNLSIFALILSSSLPFTIPNAIAEDIQEKSELELERYTDSKEGFTLLKPSSYIKVDKAGATVLLEEENKKANNVGIVVNPVRLTSLTEFGTPQFVADKLIQAEKRKESTKEAEVIGVAERPGLDGLPVYEFEYVVDSTRGGMKRIFSAAFVSRKKLYLLNISHVDKPESPLDNHTRTILEQVLHSFDAVPST
ncbi:psbP domain-containing protein 2, chloroplastic-like [Chenopodium quinoa]|uniref:PsbP C-terminal domain-containing protein n=1 Tax=Chenopodium quinoa TaxID=63459 RepID=A0A803L4T0_CHEQI|nr:psbP domain-containing protein 2, chloroplastic-like [Chenopodium quinoa]